MAVTININNLTLCHKGSDGVSTATVPDVCKTPSPGGPVPVPYANISFSKDLARGTTTVNADGGNMIANLGSEFSASVGDEPGTLGGVKSGVNMKESTWITYSFDVFMEGKNACRLTDKKFQNHCNTVDAAGLLQAPLDAWPELIILCRIICGCDKAPVRSSTGGSELKEFCVKKALLAQDSTLQNKSRIKPEIPYNMTTDPPSPLLHRGLGLAPTENLMTRMIQEGLKSAGQNGGLYQVRVPDVIIARDLSQPLTAGNLKAVVEIKFNNQAYEKNQIRDYEKIAGDPNRMIELSPEECKCKLPEEERVPALERERQQLEATATQSSSSLFDVKNWEAITGLTGTALVLYLVVSEGSRLFPPRNLVPIP
jgi:hypothetical protein